MHDPASLHDVMLAEGWTVNGREAGLHAADLPDEYREGSRPCRPRLRVGCSRCGSGPRRTRPSARRPPARPAGGCPLCESPQTRVGLVGGRQERARLRGPARDRVGDHAGASADAHPEGVSLPRARRPADVRARGSVPWSLDDVRRSAHRGGRVPRDDFGRARANQQPADGGRCCLGVGRAGVRVADPGREELGHALGAPRAGAPDDGLLVRSSRSASLNAPGSRLARLVVRSHTLPRQFIRVGDLCAGHRAFKSVPRLTGFFIPVCAGDVEPHVREHEILEHALAFGIQDPEVALRGIVSLLGSPAVPRRRFGVVLLYAVAVVIRNPEVELRAGVALPGSPAEPRRRFGAVLRHALAVGIRDPEVKLRPSVSLFGSPADPRRRFGVVLRYARRRRPGQRVALRSGLASRADVGRSRRCRSREPGMNPSTTLLLVAGGRERNYG